MSEAENVFFDNDGRIVKLGKHLHPGDAGEYSCGEFLGLWRLSARGCEIWRETFEALDVKLERKDPFQQAAEWRKSYITDFSQELIDRGNRIDTTIIQRGWAEIDTQQDYERLAEITPSKAFKPCTRERSKNDAIFASVTPQGIGCAHLE